MKERNTKQKQAIYEALCVLGHPTATEVYEYLHRDNPTISRGTVFRVLGGFAESGRARRLHLSGSDERFDATLTPHFHARCRRCGRVRDVFLPELNKALDGFEAEDFIVDSFEAEFGGLCRDCAESAPETLA